MDHLFGSKKKQEKARKKEAANYLIEEGPKLHESLREPGIYNEEKGMFEQTTPAWFEHIFFPCELYRC